MLYHLVTVVIELFSSFVIPWGEVVVSFWFLVLSLSRLHTQTNKQTNKQTKNDVNTVNSPSHGSAKTQNIVDCAIHLERGRTGSSLVQLHDRLQ